MDAVAYYRFLFRVRVELAAAVARTRLVDGFLEDFDFVDRVFVVVVLGSAKL